MKKTNETDCDNAEVEEGAVPEDSATEQPSQAHRRKRTPSLKAIEAAALLPIDDDESGELSGEELSEEKQAPDPKVVKKRGPRGPYKKRDKAPAMVQVQPQLLEDLTTLSEEELNEEDSSEEQPISTESGKKRAPTKVYTRGPYKKRAQPQAPTARGNFRTASTQTQFESLIELSMAKMQYVDAQTQTTAQSQPKEARLGESQLGIDEQRLAGGSPLSQLLVAEMTQPQTSQPQGQNPANLPDDITTDNGGWQLDPYNFYIPGIPDEEPPFFNPSAPSQQPVPVPPPIRAERVSNPQSTMGGTTANVADNEGPQLTQPPAMSSMENMNHFSDGYMLGLQTGLSVAREMLLDEYATRGTILGLVAMENAVTQFISENPQLSINFLQFLSGNPQVNGDFILQGAAWTNRLSQFSSRAFDMGVERYQEALHFLYQRHGGQKTFRDFVYESEMRVYTHVPPALPMQTAQVPQGAEGRSNAGGLSGQNDASPSANGSGDAEQQPSSTTEPMAPGGHGSPTQ